MQKETAALCGQGAGHRGAYPIGIVGPRYESDFMLKSGIDHKARLMVQEREL